jgi:hypothetical protein
MAKNKYEQAKEVYMFRTLSNSTRQNMDERTERNNVSASLVSGGVKMY